MRLADFIETHCEPILAEWEAFASTTGPAGSTMDRVALRDRALAMLNAMVLDLRSPQTETEQADKGRGHAKVEAGAPDTAAEVHGAERAESGFTVEAMVSEYRALRASVLRLWTKATHTLTEGDFDDLIRFNETIDQALAESIQRYALDVTSSRDVFLAVLGHDLRSPLGAMTMASQFMLDTGELQEPHLTLTTRIARSARRMNALVNDLLDLTRSRLGSGIPIVRAEMDLKAEAAHAIDEVRDANPGAVLQLNASGDLRGNWDCGRVSQVLANLLGNAVQHGLPKSKISLTVRGEASDVVLQVHNYGVSIPDDARAGLFDPLKRINSGNASKGNLGLGLYIAERIVAAHGGSITVDSAESSGTFFTVRLPRWDEPGTGPTV
ncbi:MAG: sensor histidine kinase [bacterium]